MSKDEKWQLFWIVAWTLATVWTIVDTDHYRPWAFALAFVMVVYHLVLLIYKRTK